MAWVFNPFTGTFDVALTSGGGGVFPSEETLADATSVTFNPISYSMGVQTNTQSAGTLTVNAPSGSPSDGQRYTFRLKSTNVQNFSWNGIFVGSTDVPLPVSSTGGSKYDYMTFMYNTAASKWNIVARTFAYT
jgi:hypothetical protein